MTTIDLDTITLTSGAHSSRADGVCIMEAAAWLAGEKHSDHPQCVSPVLAEFGRRLNDALADGQRQYLKPFLPRLLNTAGDGRDETRGYMALDWLIRTYTPAWLDLAGLTAEASALRDVRRVADLVAAQAAAPVMREARDKSAATWDAAGDAAWAVAWDAAWDAAWAAAWSAARSAAWALMVKDLITPEQFDLLYGPWASVMGS